MKKKWRDKTRKNEDEPEKVTEPGQVVSVDQMVSPTPGIIAQMTGILLITKRYKYATVFVDQYSRFSYVHLQKTATVTETIEAKKAFERYVKDRQAQVLTFAAVGAHHLNGIDEQCIRELQDMTRTMLIHSNNRWKGSITANLWPYALRMANDAINDVPKQVFSNTKVYVNPKSIGNLSEIGSCAYASTVS
eukprot:scaffold84501_cov28-Attheya_sp.AAC.3